MLSGLIKFGEWLPDKGDLNNPGATVALNVVPVGDDYTPVETVNETTDALPDECLGFFSCIDSSGNPHTFAGTAEALWKLSGTTWNDVTKLSGAYTTAGDNRWRFVQYGDFVVGTNYNDNIQVYDLTTSTEFDDLAGSPPKAKYLAVVNNFLFAVSVFDAVDGSRTSRIAWCGLDDITAWTPDVQTQADRQDIAGYGVCGALVGSQNSAILFMSQGILRLDYVGPATVFNITLMEPNAGTLVAGSVVSYSNRVFYLGEDGFNMFNGATSVPIGFEKIDNWFKANVDYNNLWKMESAINPRRKQVIWKWPSASSGGVCDSILVYNWETGRWGYAQQNVEAFGLAYSQSVLSDSLSFITDDVDTLADGAEYAGGRAVLGLVTGDHKLGFFSGTGRECVIETGEQRLNVNGRAFLHTVVPVVDCDDVSVQVLYRDKQSDSPTESGSQVINEATEEANFMVDARYMRLRITMNGSWSRAQGVQLGFRPSGRL